MFYKLPPTGNAIVVENAGPQLSAIERQWEPFNVRWYGSGTSALAACVQAAVARHKVKGPEVLVPAYGCPDVVSAVLHAGAKPVFIDLVPDRPWLDLDQLQSCIGPATVAVIAINFLGIPERVSQLRGLTAQAGLTIIEDCAQAFPLQREEVAALSGDFVVLSFGRGKPVSLLGGGAVLSRSDELSHLLPTVGDASRRGASRIYFRLRVAAYNLLRKPRLYWALDALPFVGLGDTVFVPLPDLESPDRDFLENLQVNIERYRRLGRVVQDRFRETLSRSPLSMLTDLSELCSGGSRPRLLRYPLLVHGAGARDRIYLALEREGMGVSRMYSRPMVDIPGVRDVVRVDARFPNAQRFANELLTLPTHAQVRRRDVEKIASILAMSNAELE
jgi:dTDP-4-amino-4,6-dideoxygalactose transaminase